MQDCIFCKIAQKQIPSEIVYEDEQVIAFKDINAQAPVHVLVIPKKHIPTLLDVGDEDSALLIHLHKVINELVKKLNLEDNGFRVVNNCKEDGGQTVMHLHFHLLGGRRLKWPPG